MKFCDDMQFPVSMKSDARDLLEMKSVFEQVGGFTLINNFGILKIETVLVSLRSLDL